MHNSAIISCNSKQVFLNFIIKDISQLVTELKDEKGYVHDKNSALSYVIENMNIASHLSHVIAILI